jgi:pilus assembly protein CpaB
MRAMFGLVLVAGIGLAGSAVYMAKGYIGKTQSALEQQQQLMAQLGPITRVYVLTKAKNYGDPLLPEDVQLTYWPEQSLPEGTFFDETALFPPGNRQGRYVLRQMEPNEPVLGVKITNPGEPPGLTGQLAKGMRAFAINVNVESGVGGFLQPGDFVDIYWTGSVNGMEGNLTRLIETSTRIIAVDQQADATSGMTVSRTVTVVATPEQVARLAHAQNSGRLALSLLGSADDKTDRTVETTLKDVLDIQTPQIAQVEQEKVCTIRQRNGGAVIEVPVPCTN